MVCGHWRLGRQPTVYSLFSSYLYYYTCTWVSDLENLENHIIRRTVQFSCSVVSDSLRPHESQHARAPCPSPTPELTQTHVHWVTDAIQLSHSLLSPFPPALNLSQHQGLFKWVGSSYQVAKVLEFQLQHQTFQWIFRTEFKEEVKKYLKQMIMKTRQFKTYRMQ